MVSWGSRGLERRAVADVGDGIPAARGFHVEGPRDVDAGGGEHLGVGAQIERRHGLFGADAVAGDDYAGGRVGAS